MLLSLPTERHCLPCFIKPTCKAVLPGTLKFKRKTANGKLLKTVLKEGKQECLQANIPHFRVNLFKVPIKRFALKPVTKFSPSWDIFDHTTNGVTRFQHHFLQEAPFHQKEYHVLLLRCEVAGNLVKYFLIGAHPNFGRSCQVTERDHGRYASKYWSSRC